MVTRDVELTSTDRRETRSPGRNLAREMLYTREHSAPKTAAFMSRSHVATNIESGRLRVTRIDPDPLIFQVERPIQLSNSPNRQVHIDNMVCPT